jgi:hypothetical protein
MIHPRDEDGPGLYLPCPAPANAITDPDLQETLTITIPFQKVVGRGSIWSGVRVDEAESELVHDPLTGTFDAPQGDYLRATMSTSDCSIKLDGRILVFAVTI